jgi:SAM-dependent methyltransferase
MIAICRIILLGLATVWASSAGAEEAQRTSLGEQLSRQESIYFRQGDQTVEGYTVNRALALYADGLPSEFDRALARLGPTDRWLDIGAGEANAILDYYTPAYDRTHPEGQAYRGVKAQAIAMSIEDRRTPQWQQTAARLPEGQIRYLWGKRLGQYSLEELGQFDVITDMIGGFSYTDNLARFMEKVMGLLEVNGSFFTVLQDVQGEHGTNRPFYAGAPFLTEIVDADGAELKICSWLKRITCAQVTCESRPQWQPPVEAFRVTKTCDNVSVPVLAPVHYQAGTPPERRFKLLDSVGRSASAAK